MKQIVFVLLGAVVFFAPHQLHSQSQCQPQAIPYPRMGANLADPFQLPWVNLWHNINPWHSMYNDGIEFGADGWTTPGRRHRFIAGADVPLTRFVCPAGVYKVSWKGRIDQILMHGQPIRNGVESHGGTVQNIRENYPEPGYGYFEINYPNPPSSIEFTIDGRIEDVRIVRPGFELDDTRVIHPKYTDLLADFTSLRFMGFLQSNAHAVNSEYACEGPASIEWHERANPNLPTAAALVRDGKGGAWEYIVQICNELDKDPWINIPIVASDQYVRELARLFKETLKPTLNINIEIANETWNTAGGFCSFRQIVNHFCGSDWECHQIFPAKRLKEVIDIFAEVFGWSEINNRVRGVLCGQSGYGSDGHGWTISAGLSYLERTFGEGTVHRYLYAVGAGPYFNTLGADSDVNVMLRNMEISINEKIFGEFSDEYHHDSDQWMGNKLEGWLGEAGQYGLKLYAYEGGPDMDYTSGGAYHWDGTPNKQDKDRALRDPRMIELCETYWTKWYGRYGYDALFQFFLAQFNNNALYTLGEHLDTLSTRQIAINNIVRNPAPPFDTTIRHVIPGTIDARKVAAYWSGWEREPALLYKRGEIRSPEWHPPSKWIFAASKNGTYRFSVEQASHVETDIDVYLDGVMVRNLRIPATGDLPSPFLWSSDQGVDFEMDLSYGIHVIRFNYRRDTDCSVRKLRFDLVSESPPFAPGRVMGDLGACLGNPAARYSVDIDQSVCEYEWDESAILAAGAHLLPPGGGGGAVRNGQGTNVISIDWTGVPEGTYPLRVRGTNDVGAGPWRDFTVTVSICGFVIQPGSGCIDEPITFTPHAPPGTREWSWTFGPSAHPYTAVDATGAPMAASYSTSGSKAVQLTITNQEGERSTFTNTLVIGDTRGGTVSASAQTINAGESVTLSLAGYRGYVVRWERSGNGSDWSSTGSVDLPYHTDPLNDTTWFRAIVRDGGCTETPSTVVRVAVTDPVSAGRVVPVEQEWCAGVPAGQLTLEGSGGSVVRWESSPAPSGTWTPIASQSRTHDPGVLQSGTRYRAIVNLGGNEFASEAATVRVTAAMLVSAISGPAQGCPGQSGLAYSVQPVSGASSYAWTLPAGVTITSGQGTNSITVALSDDARSGAIALTVQGECGPASPPPRSIETGALQIQRLSFREPSMRGERDGVLYVHFAHAPPSGFYTVDLHNDGSFSFTGQLLAGDSLAVTGFDDADSIVNVTVQPQGAPCASTTFPVRYTFQAQIIPVLAAPRPVPGSGTFRADTVRIHFAQTEETPFSTVYWTTCSDTSTCALTTANRQVYHREQGILLSISGGGGQGIVFGAFPLDAYRNHYKPSTVATAWYQYRPEFSPLRGAYYDGTGDGKIDSLRIFFAQDMARVPDQIRVSPPGTTDPLGTGAVAVQPVRVDDRVFAASWRNQPFTRIQTGFAAGMYAALRDPHGYFSQEPFVMHDSVAPVILSARYIIAGEALSDIYYDTLRVEFSEGVQVAGSAPLVIEGSASPLRLERIKVDGPNLTALVPVSELNKRDVPTDGQLLFVETGFHNSVTDGSGNRQSNPDNRRVPIKVVPPPDVFQSVAGPTLFTPGMQSFRMVLSPNERLGGFSGDSKASLSISDPLGAIVFSQNFTLVEGEFRIEWDGKNRSGALVARGTYVALVTTSISGTRGSRKIKIGVER